MEINGATRETYVPSDKMSTSTQGKEVSVPVPRFSTRAVHVGQTPEKEFGAVAQPVYMTSTYKQDWPAQDKGYDYSRAGNPNFSNLEAQIASLEGGRYATVFSAGLAAFTAMCTGLKQGDSVGGFGSMYGGTYRLLTRVFAEQGINLSLVPVGDWGALETLLKTERPKLFIFETPTNPLLEVIDIQRAADLCKQYGTLCVVDNTFASPYLQNPLRWGADIVIHSATKYLGGHSDVIGGVLVTNLEEIKKRADFNRLCLGLNPSPFDTWLISRSIKTLAIRMERHSSNALAFAKWLESEPLVSKVTYPGLESHPDHEVAVKQMEGKRGFSGMVAAEFRLSLRQTERLVASCKVFCLAESLGGVESLVETPASMTHASLPAEERQKIGISDGLVRFSVGIEDVEDLIADVRQALEIALADTEGEEGKTTAGGATGLSLKKDRRTLSSD
uniref:cystathionine gamma-lyase n=1 Tax=Chromera velia CCMP2878 TaxID=1169474 RepID=A0A0G4HJ95_9ALVE|eukprot:Cvel_28055.t1-p1 / transcript=Cvel_28055.t1 / gene=Cvel_28055 / organism=Chromera_velia_CCMP2878 / gene_product=Cystathionine beta-lyase, putative / transcript_product=Cystathionine beta-lyase, putative / location=Cvel_scaffold3606:7521-11571(-) / protein_length=445 / sequence_SO=supercontig / SO=protein_coding / is_pseudo=false